MTSGHERPARLLLHASAVALGGRAVLLRGASGAGKSDLTLRLIDEGAQLVADDQVELTADANGRMLIAAAPEAIAGMLEVRGIGILRLPLLGIDIPVVAIDPHTASAAAKVRMAVAVAGGDLADGSEDDHSGSAEP